MNCNKDAPQEPCFQNNIFNMPLDNQHLNMELLSEDTENGNCKILREHLRDTECVEDFPPTSLSSNIQNEKPDAESESPGRTECSTSSEKFEPNERYLDKIFGKKYNSQSSLTAPKDPNDVASKLAKLNIFSKPDLNVNLDSITKLTNVEPMGQDVQENCKFKCPLSLRELSLREDNVIEMLIPIDCVKGSLESPNVNLFSDILNTVVRHTEDEFSAICSCKDCLLYREFVIHILMEQCRTSQMVVMLFDVLLNAYSPLLRNGTAFIQLHKLLENNKEIYWLASGITIAKNFEELNLISDSNLTDPMVLVLNSSILMISNPMLLVRILSFHIRCIVQAFAAGMRDVSEGKLAYIIDGFDELTNISQYIAPYFHTLETAFLKIFSLTWVSLCQAIFVQHVYVKYAVAIVSCGDMLSDDNPLKRRYEEFSEKILLLVGRCNKFTWPAIQRFNSLEAEKGRRKLMLDIHKLLYTVIEDANRVPLQEQVEENIFPKVITMENRQRAWQLVMGFAKQRWPQGFFNEPDIFFVDLKCEKCGDMCEHYNHNCNCITCSVSLQLMPIRLDQKQQCLKCFLKSKHFLDELKEVQDTIQPNIITESDKTYSNAYFEQGIFDMCPDDIYHISWIVFKSLNNRKRYIHQTVDPKYFCNDCTLPTCMLARKVLNNDFSPVLTNLLLLKYQPLQMLQEEIRAVLPYIFFYSRQMLAEHARENYHDLVIEAFWAFITSLYGTYFVDLETAASPLNLDAIELYKDDLRLLHEKLTGNENDTSFVDFFFAVQSFPSPNESDVMTIDWEFYHSPLIQETIDEFLKVFQASTPPSNDTERSVALPKRPEILENLLVGSKEQLPEAEVVTEQPTASDPIPESATCDNKNADKRNCNLKAKKCCLEHATDLGTEQCKENHSTKKRLKKECSHARINETRDRLRKKLQNTRKHQQQLQQKTTSSRGEIAKEKQTNSTDQPQQEQQSTDATDPPKPQENSKKNVTNQDNIKATQNKKSEIKDPCPKGSTSVQGNGAENGPEPNIETVDEICDMLDNNKVKMKNWINETLTYIEGYDVSSSANSSSSNRNKGCQPQPTNSKKAAKKAKQKLRKEEEKRIEELHEVRAQFQDLYFKEFVDKLELKNLKSANNGPSNGNGGSVNSNGNKRRCDKKKISELEVNIKKLQRAKAKIEANILELIATVKQTNIEFRFSYLPTKEQQQAKLEEIESTKAVEKLKSEPEAEAESMRTPDSIVVNQMKVDSSNITMAPLDSRYLPNFNIPVFEMIFPTATPNNLSYGLRQHPSFPPQTNSYVPPQPQLSPNVMAALTANNNSSKSDEGDPSKRIVTIRRIPNVADSQVTVTARGSSPNEDKLLYTFINGQLVQTQAPTIESMSGKNSHSQVLPTKPTKTQLKKERRLARLALEQKCLTEENLNKQGSVHEKKSTREREDSQKPATKNQNKNERSNESSTNSRSSVSKADSTGSSKNKLKTQKNKNSKEETSSLIHAETKKETRNENKRKNKTNNSHSSPQRLEKELAKDMEPIQNQKQQKPPVAVNKPALPPPPNKTNIKAKSTSTKSATVSENTVVKKEKVKREQRSQKLANLGQFDNNPFKSLHMQDSDTEFDLTGSSESEDDNFSAETKQVARNKIELPKVEKNAKSINKKSKEVVNQKPTATIVATSVEDTKGKILKISESKTKANGNGNGNKQQAIKLCAPEISKNEPQNRNKKGSATCSSVVAKANKNSSNERTNSRIYTNSNVKTKLPAPSVLTTTMKGPSRTSLNSLNSSTLHDSKSISKKAQKSKTQKERQQQKQTVEQHQQHFSYDQGIPARMDHFDARKVNAPISQQQNPHYDSLADRFQNMHVSSNPQMSYKSLPNYASVKVDSQSTHSTNISIMDQLNRGVQVENLSLPPGITLTKVDPIKSEQLRLKSESIKRRAQPLQSNNSSNTSNNNNSIPYTSTPFQHSSGNMIIAPPVTNYLAAPYAAALASSGVAAPLEQGNIIMVEGVPSKVSKTNKGPASAACSTTGTGGGSQRNSKSKRRRNKAKNQEACPRDNMKTNSNKTDPQNSKIITLRNPMFHTGPAAAAASVLQQPSFLGGHHGTLGDGSPFPMAMSVDQPAAIIKNENGMFTIRNPALHQAVTNGLGLGGYRQMGGNVSYYTPQQAVAEAAKATQLQKQQQQQQQQQLQQQQQSQQFKSQKSKLSANAPTESFSYFSNNLPEATSKPILTESRKPDSSLTNASSASNKIDMNCSSVGNKEIPGPISRPSSAQKCISAIGSEIKHHRISAKLDNSHYSCFGLQDAFSRSHENLSSAAVYLTEGDAAEKNKSASPSSASTLHGRYQHSPYFNGFDAFSSMGNRSTTTIGGGCSRLAQSSNSLFDASVSSCHMPQHSHHSCGDDSPPPTNFLGYSSTYLDDIPNTGVIRYDDASFLKNLIPGQRLNKEVSIHSVNESNFGRNTSPMSHLVEITPVYGGSKQISPTTQIIQNEQHMHRYDRSSSAFSTARSYSNNLKDFDPNIFLPAASAATGESSFNLNLSDVNKDNTASCGSTGNTSTTDKTYLKYNYELDNSIASSSQLDKEKSSPDLNDFFTSNLNTPIQRKSPYFEELTMEGFVQNLNALQISNSSATDQIGQQHPNGGSGRNSVGLGSASNNNSTNSTPANGWW